MVKKLSSTHKDIINIFTGQIVFRAIWLEVCIDF